jgi:pimeloyl-ACP methyl ester carboxylesterase
MVRTAIIGSIAPVQINLPLVFAADAARALDRLIDSCAAQRDCKEAFPNLRAELDSILQRFDRGPVSVRVDDEAGTFNAVLGRTAFGYALRGMMYGELGRFIPLLLQRAHETEDLSWFANYFVSRSQWPWTQYPAGLNLAVLGHEDAARASSAEKRALERTSFGPDLYGQYLQACSWLRVKGSSALRPPVRNDLPMLIFSGEFDPSTPLEYGTLVARDFPNSLHVVWKGAGHGGGDISCRNHLMTQLLQTGSTRDLDQSCTTRSASAPVFFPTRGPAPPPVAR